MKVPQDTQERSARFQSLKLKRLKPPSFFGEQTTDQTTKGLFLPISTLPHRKLRHEALIRFRTDCDKGKIPIQKFTILNLSLMIYIVIHEHLYIHMYELLYRSIVYKVVAGIIRLSYKLSYHLVRKRKLKKKLKRTKILRKYITDTKYLLRIY